MSRVDRHSGFGKAGVSFYVMSEPIGFVLCIRLTSVIDIYWY